MKKIVIITQRAGYPNGYGATSILKKYAKGFITLGFKVDILILKPSEISLNQSINDDVFGVSESVNFKYLCSRTVTSRYRVIRMLLFFRGLIGLIFYIVKNKTNIDTIFFYSPESYLSSAITNILGKVFHVKVVGIKTESSVSDVSKKNIKNLLRHEKRIFKHFTRMITISHYLKQQLLTFNYKGKIDVVPIIIEEKEITGSYNTRDKNIIYIGSLSYNDDIVNLINIYSKFKKNNPSWKLDVYGDFNSSTEQNKIMNLVYQKSLIDSVTFHGYVSNDKVHNILCSSGIAVLPRTKNESSTAGFPIKLGEYLVSGIPTVSFNVGELSSYLVNERDIILVTENKIDDFVEILNRIASNYQSYHQMGLSGRKIALLYFGANSICKRMLNYE